MKKCAFTNSFGVFCVDIYSGVLWVEKGSTDFNEKFSIAFFAGFLGGTKFTP